MLTPRTLLAASHRSGLRRLVTVPTTTRRVVDRFVAGESLADVLEVVRTLTGQGMSVTLDHLGKEVTDRTEARRSRDAYLTALDGLAPLKLGCRAEVSVKLSAFGQGLANGGHDLALGLVRPVVAAAATPGTTVTLDMEDSRTVDSPLAVLGELREQYPGTGAVLQAMLRRTEEDAALLAGPASRVRQHCSRTTSRCLGATRDQSCGARWQPVLDCPFPCSPPSVVSDPTPQASTGAFRAKFCPPRRRSKLTGEASRQLRPRQSQGRGPVRGRRAGERRASGVSAAC